MTTSPGIDAALLRASVPKVLAVLIRRGADFAMAEDAVQEALIKALDTWTENRPADPTAWLITVAWRRYLDMVRSNTKRSDRELRVATEPDPGEASGADDTLTLYFLCAHPMLSPASAVALTLRAVGGLTTRQIAEAYLVPEATMAQRISRAKAKLADADLGRPGDLGAVMHVLYLMFNEGYSGDLDLASEAIRLARSLADLITDTAVADTASAEASGLVALMLLHHARRTARTSADGSLVPLADQDRSLWDTSAIVEGVAVLQGALAWDRLGPYQAQAAIAALHADAPSVEQTDWIQIVGWYDELLRLSDTPVVRLNRAVAVCEADGAPAGLAALADVDESVPRRSAVAAYLHERNGDLNRAADLYAEAARLASDLQERNHQTRQAARVNQVLLAQGDKGGRRGPER